MNRKRLAVAYLAYVVMLACGTWSLSWGQTRAVTRRVGPVLPGSSAATPKFNPARNGGIGALGVSLKGGLAAPALPVSALGSESPLGLPMTSIPLEDPFSPDAIPGAAEASGLGTLGSVEAYAAQVVPGSDGKDKSPEDVNDAAGRIYDKKAPETGAVDAGGVNFAAAGGDGTGGEGGGTDIPGAADPSSPLNHFYPRVVFVQDVFGKAASEKTVEYMEKLLNGGVHVVFLTWRPQKGPGSADEVILSRIKAHRNNPVVVVAFNGGKISLHGRAANPKSVIEDVDAFKPADIDAFAAINAKVSKTLKLAGSLKEAALPSKEAAFSYTVELPDQIPQGDLAKARASALKAYNTQLQAAGLPYRMAEHPENPRALITQSMPLRFSLPRVMNALEGVFPGENLQAAPEKFLILADSKRSPRFTSSFPEASQIQVAKSGQEVEDIFGAVLGNRALPSVSVKLGKLRQYVEYWEPSKRWMNTDETSGGGGGGGGGIRGPKSDRATSQMLSMYTGGLMYQMMAWFYEQVWRGQHQMTSLSAMQARLRSMWRSPFKYGVYVSKPLAKTMNTPAWKAMNRGYMEHANSYLTNFYLREFGDYTTAARNVQDNLVGLATDRKSLITLEFASSSTGKLYRIHTRIPRVMKLDTSEGRVLTAYAYRTGKETPDNGEEVFAKTLAMSLLKGHGRMGLDGKWHHGSPEGAVIARLRVQLEYRSSHRSWEFTPEEFYKVVVTPAADGKAAGVSESVQGPIVQQITSTIERMEADPEYQAHYDEQEQKASKDDLKKKGAKGKATAKTAAKPAKAPAKAAAAAKKTSPKGRGK